ncbi:unnamed protein product [Amoebophrya sp. A25]|nr:unnamed protein product [Amoebophrya sp. A25]|eukprot:GSA25T00016372001.1
MSCCGAKSKRLVEGPPTLAPSTQSGAEEEDRDLHAAASEVLHKEKELSTLPPSIRSSGGEGLDRVDVLASEVLPRGEPDRDPLHQVRRPWAESLGDIYASLWPPNGGTSDFATIKSRGDLQHKWTMLDGWQSHREVKMFDGSRLTDMHTLQDAQKTFRDGLVKMLQSGKGLVAIKKFLNAKQGARGNLGIAMIGPSGLEFTITPGWSPSTSKSSFIQKLPPSHQIDYSDSIACISMLLVLLGIFLLWKVARKMRMPTKDKKNKTGDAKPQMAGDYGTLAGADATTEV